MGGGSRKEFPMHWRLLPATAVALSLLASPALASHHASHHHDHHHAAAHHAKHHAHAGRRSHRDSARKAAHRRVRPAMQHSGSFSSSGIASWYGSGDRGGQRVASGGRYRQDGLTAAHRSLPFGTRVEVTNRRTGRSVAVTINDRGPFVRGRIIDLSRGAARTIGCNGLCAVGIRVAR